ncbi:MAG TPA: hypothetical protein VGM88_21125 [Kofleriaceae bacterium]
MAVIESILGAGFAGANLFFWWWVATRGEKRFRAWCERRYEVTIVMVGKGYWEVRGKGSWLRRGAIGWLQLAYFMAMFLVWALALIGVLLVGALLTDGKP